MWTFFKRESFLEKYYRKSACKTNKKAHTKKKTIYLGQVIKILIFVNKNIKYDIY